MLGCSESNQNARSISSRTAPGAFGRLRRHQDARSPISAAARLVTTTRKGMRLAGAKVAEQRCSFDDVTLLCFSNGFDQERFVFGRQVKCLVAVGGEDGHCCALGERLALDDNLPGHNLARGDAHLLSLPPPRRSGDSAVWLTDGR